MLQPDAWIPKLLTTQIRLEVPGLEKKGAQSQALQISFTQEMIHERYPQHFWIQMNVQKMPYEMVKVGSLSRSPPDLIQLYLFLLVIEAPTTEQRYKLLM